MGTQVLIVSQALYLGGVYALIALGLTISYSSTRVVNFAQGEYFVFGAGVAYYMQSVKGQPAWVALLVLLAGSAVFGLVSERAIMLPIYRSGIHYAWIISTLAVALTMQSVYSKVFEGALLRPPPLVDGAMDVFGGRVAYQVVIVIGAAVIIMVAYDQMLRRTSYGSAVRATAQDPDTASTFGISVRGIVVTSFVVSAMITAVAGMLVSPVLFIEPTVGLTYTTSGFVAMVIGGLGSVRGAIVGGFVVGILNALVVNLIGPNYGQITVVCVLAVILLVRPTGLFASPSAAH